MIHSKGVKEHLILFAAAIEFLALMRLLRHFISQILTPEPK